MLVPNNCIHPRTWWCGSNLASVSTVLAIFFRLWSCPSKYKVNLSNSRKVSRGSYSHFLFCYLSIKNRKKQAFLLVAYIGHFPLISQSQVQVSEAADSGLGSPQQQTSGDRNTRFLFDNPYSWFSVSFFTFMAKLPRGSPSSMK